MASPPSLRRTPWGPTRTATRPGPRSWPRWERMGGQLGRLREQLAGIDERHGRAVTTLVPAGEAVLRLREAVVAGTLPGVDRQSQLFRDALGHATQPTMDVVTYLWFAALYDRPLAGLTTLVEPDDPTSAARQAVLQRVAAETLADEAKHEAVPG